MKPLIGITCVEDYSTERYFLAYAYAEAIKGAGGIPILLAPVRDPEVAVVLGSIDGLLLSGGSDVDPFLFNEEPHPKLGEITPVRDRFELSLTRLALMRDLPLLAICRGMQVLNIAAGGTIIQDISSEIANSVKHSQQAPRWYPTHGVNLEQDTKLLRIYKNHSIRVNSFHHQAVREQPPGFVVSGRAEDGVIEAMESLNHSFVLGVQWHPECMYDKDNETRKLFESFVLACQKTS